MKKKKMTKAEAFEWLKGKRVACDCSNTEAAQRKFFNVGIRWRGGSSDVNDCASFLFIDADGCLRHCWSRKWFDLYDYEEISVDDILSIEIIEDSKIAFERNEHIKALQEIIAKSGYIDCIIISKNDVGILKK